VVAAIRRLGIIFVSIAGGTAVVSLVAGLALGAALGRSLSLGWYVVGSVLLISGFFVGNRGPSRPQGEGWHVASMKRWVRWASPEEQRESISLSALLVVLGFVLIVLGVLADTRHPIV
jgi:hypothetical protein